MFALILAVVFSGNSDDRLPEVSLSFAVQKVSIVRDSLKMIPPNKITFDNMNKIGKTRQAEKPNPDLIVVMDNWN